MHFLKYFIVTTLIRLIGYLSHILQKLRVGEVVVQFMVGVSVPTSVGLRPIAPPAVRSTFTMLACPPTFYSRYREPVNYPTVRLE